MKVTEPDLAYLAGILDVRGNITTRRVEETLLPVVQVSVKSRALMDWLCAATGMRMVVTRRDFVKGGCSQHCSQKHVHVVSESMRWTVTGAKATVVLAAVLPLMRVRADEADLALRIGLKAPHKPGTLRKMESMGWKIPDFGEPD